MANRMAVVCGCILMSAMGASAMVGIIWNQDGDGLGPIQNHLGGDLVANRIVQLIYSPDNIISALNPLNPLVPTGGEEVLDTQASSSSGGWGGYWTLGGVYGTGPAGGQYVGGYAYQRVFDVDMAATPTIGDYYRDGLISSALTDGYGAPPPPPSFTVPFYNSGDGTPIQINTLIVPEPATMGLFGLGLVIMALRRKIRG